MYTVKERGPAPVGAADQGIGTRVLIEMLRTAEQVCPDDRRVMVEPETPVRCDARGHRRALRLALIDRGQPAREQDLAADLQLLGRLVTGIDAPRRLQPFELGFIEDRKSPRLNSSH